MLFKIVYILTYLFPASILKYYFDLRKITYYTQSVKLFDGKYTLCDYYEPCKSGFIQKIHIYSKSDLNDRFTQKSTALSAAWFKNPGNASKIKLLKDNIYNYFTSKCPAKSGNIMWSTFKDAKHKLKGKGYSTRFICKFMSCEILLLDKGYFAPTTLPQKSNGIFAPLSIPGIK